MDVSGLDRSDLELAAGVSSPAARDELRRREQEQERRQRQAEREQERRRKVAEARESLADLPTGDIERLAEFIDGASLGGHHSPQERRAIQVAEKAGLGRVSQRIVAQAAEEVLDERRRRREEPDRIEAPAPAAADGGAIEERATAGAVVDLSLGELLLLVIGLGVLFSGGSEDR